LRPALAGIKDLRYFRVYNRWGQLIFETKAENAGWDGTVKGVKQQFKQNLFKIGFDTMPQNNSNGAFEIVKENDDRSFTVKIKEGHRPNDVLQYYLQQQAGITSFNEILPSLNDIFINLVEGTPAARQFQPVAM
jgi:ABC-2 type transport system ATP-binding protein